MVVVVVEKDYDSNDKIFHHYRIFDSIVSVVDNLLVVTNELKQKKKFKKNKKKLFHMMISTQQNGNKIHLEANGKKDCFFSPNENETLNFEWTNLSIHQSIAANNGYV